MITSLLKTVENIGTGKSASQKYGFKHMNAAGKTGTTSNWVDAWFVGYSQHIIAGVYVGVDDPLVTLGVHQSGATAALPIWANFMRRAHEMNNWPDTPFEVPDGVIRVQICSESKKVPSKYCTHLEEEWFIKGTEPIEECPVHSVIKQNGTNYDELIF